MKREHFSVVHEDNIGTLLDRLGLREELTQGKLACFYCGRPITLDNILALAPRNQQAIVICNAPHCLQTLLKESSSEPTK